MDAVPNVKNLDSLAMTLSTPLSPRRGRRQEAGKAGASSANWLPRLSFLTTGSVCEAGLGFSMALGFVFAILREHHGGSQTAQRGPPLGWAAGGVKGCCFGQSGGTTPKRGPME